MKPFEEQFTAWVDGKLSDEEVADFEKQLAAHPEAASDKESAQRLGDLLRAHPTAPRLTNPEFFNHQLLERIAAEMPRAAEPRRASFWMLPRLAWAGAFCLLTAFALWKTLIPTGAPSPGESTYFAQVVEAWPSDPSIWATTVYSPEDKVTVVWLDGLEYLPASYALN